MSCLNKALVIYGENLPYLEIKSNSSPSAN